MDEIPMNGHADDEADGEDAQHARSMAAAMAVDEMPIESGAADHGERCNKRCSVCPSMCCVSFNVDALISTTVGARRGAGAPTRECAVEVAPSAGRLLGGRWAL
jgi:hypothetical protein